MEERLPAAVREDEIDLGKLIAVLRREWRKIALLSLAAGVVTFLLMLAMPNIYQAVIAPPLEEKKPNLTLGALSSFGIDVGSPSKVEDLESLFRSNDLTVRVFNNHVLWSIILPNKFDPITGKVKYSWIDRLVGNANEPKAPSDWDAIRAAKDRLKVSVNKKASTISISFESPSADGSAKIVKYYLDEGKNHLQEEAFDRASNNNKFIEEQIRKTVDALTRDRLYTLYGQEIEQEMMARNREQFGFRIIDSPRVPDRKFKPVRVQSAILVFFLSFLAGCVFIIVRGKTGG
jgi:uncharacterized protein involved in exopolysaccharide biosynthesis